MGENTRGAAYGDGRGADNDDDLRTIALPLDAANHRCGTFLSMARDVTETVVEDWSVSGPRTTKWIIDQHLAQESPPTKRHWWWRNTLHLSMQSEGVDEHLFLCETLETALARDGLNVGELHCMELLVRRLQMWEQMYSARLREAETKTSGVQTLERDERALFLGSKAGQSLEMVCPLLEKYVASQLAERSGMLKERRKAREERDFGPDGSSGRNRNKDKNKDKKGKGEGKGEEG